MARLPGPNFTIRNSLDRLERSRLQLEEEIIERTKFVIGHPDFFGDEASFGIIDNEDPQAVLAGENRPLAVSANLTNNLNVDVNPGIAITPSGVWIRLSGIVRNVALSEPAEGVDNVVFLEYVLEDADSEENDFTVPVVPFTLRPGDPDSEEDEEIQVGVLTVEDYDALPESSRNDLVPLAIVATQTAVDPDTADITVDLSIDHTADNFDFNRPWFSSQDISHRSRVGTGTVTTTNIHGLSQNDLTVGDFSPFQTLLNHGMVLANDRTIAKVPGFRCQTSIPYSLVKTDTTSGSATGFPLKKYIELGNFPARVGRVWTESTDKDLGAVHVETTQRIVFPGDDPPVDESIGVLFTKVNAAEPPSGNNERVFSTNNPGTEELIIAGGVGHTTLASTQEQFNDAHGYPMIYELFVDADGSIRTTPQVLFCLKTLEAIGVSDTPEITQYGPAKLMMGLINAADVPTMSIKIRVFGKDSAGSDIDHLFEFTGGTWSDPGPVPNSSLPSDSWRTSLRLSDQVFSSITNVVIEERIDDGPNSAIIIWVNLNPFDTYDKMKDACHISEVVWDGLRMATIRDMRILGTTVRNWLDHEGRHPELELVVETLAGGNSTIFIEDFRAPRLHNLLHPWEDPNNILGKTSIELLLKEPDLNGPWFNFNRLQVGLHGYYRTRGLPVLSGSGLVWRVTALPAARQQFNPFSRNQPTFEWYNGTAWSSTSMTAVSGTRNTYEVTLTAVPLRIRVAWEFSAGNTAFVVYG
jgi:hypothetical protein